jgi:prophage tail gpP-like protein
MNEFQIRINGQRFDLWENAQVERSIDMTSGVFGFTSTISSPAQYPVKAGDQCQILLNDTPVITGFVDSIRAGGSSEGGQLVSVQGRDNTSDIIDSSVPDSAKNIMGPISLLSLCKLVISSLGATIPVIDASGHDGSILTDFSEDTEFTSDSGRNCIEFLIDFSRKKQVYLISDGTGSLVLYRPGGVTSQTSIVNEKNGTMNNVISWEIDYNHQERFNKYRVRSQDNFGSDDEADYSGPGVDRSGDAIDPEIRASRYIEVQSPESSDDGETLQTAIEVANLRKASASEYRCTVQGIAQPDGTVWDFGTLISVSDDFAGIQGIFLIKSVSFNIDLYGGSTTSLTIVPPEAYQVRLSTSSDDRNAIRSPGIQTSKPSTEPLFIR